MKRRGVLFILSGLAAPVRGLRAQQKGPWLIGVLNGTSPAPSAAIMAALRQGLGDAGYIDGRNLAIEYRWAYGDYEKLPALASDLLGRHVNLIVTSGPNGIAAAKAATATVPIIFFGGSDLVAAGLIAGFAHPGGNMTGMSIFARELNPKRFELLAELVARPAVIGILMNMNQSGADDIRADMESAARAHARRIVIQAASSDDQIEAAFRAFQRDTAAGLVVMGDPFFNSRRDRIVQLAAQYAIPAIYEWREFADAGGLASYGPSLTTCWRQLGVYAGRVLAGEKPGDLPVLRPTQLELVVNLRTAHTLALTIPPAFLGRADDVIE